MVVRDPRVLVAERDRERNSKNRLVASEPIDIGDERWNFGTFVLDLQKIPFSNMIKLIIVLEEGINDGPGSA